LAADFGVDDRLHAASFPIRAGRYDLIVNATSASLADVALPLAASVLESATLAYDLMYAAAPTPFMDQARRAGTTHVADGLGMLVEQAAESFRIWRGVAPRTAPVLAGLREQLAMRATA
jgi:shikimate dehydrogenase